MCIESLYFLVVQDAWKWEANYFNSIFEIFFIWFFSLLCYKQWPIFVTSLLYNVIFYALQFLLFFLCIASVFYANVHLYLERFLLVYFTLGTRLHIYDLFLKFRDYLNSCSYNKKKKIKDFYPLCTTILRLIFGCAETYLEC